MILYESNEAKLQEKTGLASIIKDSAQTGQQAAEQVLDPEGDSGLEGLEGNDADNVDGARKRKAAHEQRDDAASATSGKQRRFNEPMDGKLKLGYSKTEATDFSAEIFAKGPGKEDKRLKCAGDDVLCCLNHIFETEFSDADRQSSFDAIMRAKSLCLSLWVEFLLSGEVSLNGKRIRAYSGLRPELQHVARLAKEKIKVAGAHQDPLAMAKELARELMEAPITMVVEGEDDGLARVCAFLNEKQDAVGKIRHFVEHVLHLPLAMHEAVIDSLKLAPGKSLALVDFMSAIVETMEKHLPALWISFATDASDFFAANGGFASGCEEAGWQNNS